ncbi:MAG: aspartate kinase [Phycisphaerales bacterium]
MPTIVQKYGGTSVADPERIMRCARRAAQARRDGHRVVVVVSAMGHTTDELIELAGKLTQTPSPREMDMLMATGEQVSVAMMAMALHSLGCDATSLTGAQAGIFTDGAHRKARIARIERERLDRILDAGGIPVVCGFQGESPAGDITTLGRGGSDTTAVALAAALDVSADGGCCEIYTDVDGVYTADPRVVPTAAKLRHISYEEMLELATLGAAVMHPRAVLFGEKFNVPIHVRHSQKPDEGTLIVPEESIMEDIVVVGCALKPDLGRVSLKGLPRTDGIQAQIFEPIAAANISVDDIVQTEFGGTTTIAFTVEHGDISDLKTQCQALIGRLGQGELDIEVGLAKVSAVGTGMKSHSGVASRMFRALADAGVPIHNITTSEIKISCIVDRQHGEKALQVVHDAFGLSSGADVNAQMQSSGRARR